MDDQLVGDAGEAIAVVGVSCRFPEVNGPAQYWDLLRAGRSTIAAVPPERAATDGDRPRGSYLADPYAFDADFFGISPLEAASIDPQQRMMLELCWQAMESAGYAAAGERPREVALYLGTTADDFAGAVLRGAVPVNRFTKAGTSRAMIANRVSHALGFTGPSLTVDTGQSSSLVAVHLACAGIRSGECALALAGGVQLNLDPSSDLIMSESGVVSPDGVCYTFDARANGTVRGEGGAVVVLKPLTRALSDGDTVLAVIRGGAVGHDGPGGSLTTPAVAGQEAVIRRACRAAGVDPAAVQYVEAHGTGTPIGDPVEAEALARVYGRAPGRADALLIGSVKPTLGHLEAAAGVAGLVKVVLALGHGVLPASLHYQRPHPRIPMRSWRLQVPTSAREWVSPHGIRLAGVSAFGLGGADAHLIVEQAPRPAAAAGERVALGLSAVLLGGRGGAALRERAGRLADHLSATDDPSPVRLAQATARLARFDERAAVVTDDPAELSAALSALRDGSAHPRLVAGRAVPGRTAFVFAGQGTQRPGMGRELHDAFPAFAAAWDEAMDALTAGLDPAEAAAIRDAVWGTDAAILEQTRFAQRGLFAFEFALCRLLESWGVRADVVLGHSLGEIVAAAIAGAITLTDAARVVGARVRLLGRLRDPGAMAAVSAPEGVTRALLAGHPRGGEVDIAAVNGPEATVIAGAADAVEAVRTDLAARGLRVRRLRVSHAFHSRLMDPVLDEFAAVLADSAPLPPRLEVIANVTGRPAEPGYGSADYWVRHLRRPIRFADGLAAAQAAGVTRFVEIGPDGSLSLQVTASTGGGCTVIPLSARTGGERAALATGVGRLLVAGIEPDWPALLGTVGLRHCPQLPAYPFQHRTFRAGALAPAAVTAPPSVPENDSDPGTAPAAGPWDTDAVSALVCDELANLLGFAAGTVPPDRPFHELGLDSLGALRIHDRLTRETGLRLPASIVFDYPTPRKLARFVSGVQIAATGAPQADEAVAAANDPVVVVGMGCRFPGGVNSPAQLWRLVAEGGDAISEFPADRGWDLQRWYDPEPGVPGKAYTHWGGFLTGAGDFDAEFFNVSPREASGMDPQQRVLLEVAWEALEDAGIDAHTLRGSDTGIFTGVMSHGHDAAPRLTDGYGLTDAAASVVSGRLAYALGSEGPAITVDTACSSSLVALHLACRSIRSGECELALAGGVTVMSTPGMFVEFSRQRGLSVDGRCRSFGVGAEGTGWGEGVGVVVLERLSRARELGHSVLAVVAGSAVNQDGASNGLTAPNGPAQQRVIRAALAAAGLGVGDVDVVEGHGTATRLGDPIEVGALLATYGRRDRAGDPVWLGSVKSNVGHTQAAAGVAGVIKMVLAMRHGVLPKSLFCEQPSPHVDWDSGNVRLLDRAREWRTPEGRPRRAGISSFGISGTNAHLILEQAPEPPPAADDTSAPTPLVTQGLSVWALSARSHTALIGQANRLREFAATATTADPAAIGWSLTRRALFEHRAVIVGRERDELITGLDRIAKSDEADTDSADPQAAPVVGRTVPGVESVVLVFGGQGSQWAGMGRELLAGSPVFAASLRECEQALAPHVDWSIDAALGDAELLDRVDVLQPLLWAVMVSTARMWTAVGTPVAAVVGHSQGEIAAACVAGVLSIADAARVVAIRSRVLLRLAGSGGMAAVEAPFDQVRAHLVAGVDVAAVNGPRSVVVSGAVRALDRFTSAAEAAGLRVRRLAVDYASHSPQVDVLSAELRETLGEIGPRAGTARFYSTVTGTRIDPADLDTAYWVRNLRSPVLFEHAVRAALGDGFRAFVEVSPHPVLAAAVADTAALGGDEPVTVVASIRRDDDRPTRVLQAMAEAFVAGVEIDWAAICPPSARRLLPLPTYAFEHRRYWADARPDAGDPADLGVSAAAHPLLAAVVDEPDGRVVLTGRVSLATHGWLADHRVADRILFPGTAFVEIALRAGDEVGCALLRELTLVAPLRLPATGAIRIRVVVEPAAAAAIPERRLAIHSRPDGSDATAENWTLHAEGIVAPQNSAPARESVSSGPIAGAETVDGAELYRRLRGSGYDYGPGFRTLRRMWQRGPEIVAEIGLPDTTDVTGFGIHPALFDAALHAGLLDSGVTALPFSWSEVRLHAVGARVLRVRVGRLDSERFELTAVDTDGAPVLSAAGVLVRPIDPGLLDGERAEDPLFAIEWVPTGAAAAAAPSRAVLRLTDAPDIAADIPAGDLIIDCRGAATDLDIAPRTRALTEAALRVLRAAADAAEVMVVTSGAVALPGEAVDVASAAIWGLVRAARAERGGTVALVDTDAADALPSIADNEPELLVRQAKTYAPRLTPLPGPADPPAWNTGTVLITGGTGGLGAALARYLVAERGARSVVLASRQGAAAPGADGLLRGLAAAGASVRAVACDVGDRAAVARLVGDIVAHGRLSAVVHTAGVLDDGPLAALTPERLAAVLRPKAEGAWYLHECTRELDLDHFVLFSSVVGVLGGAGQANYAAANAFLDAVARHRRAAGLPALSMAWGLWEQATGMTAHLRPADRAALRDVGIAALPTERGWALLDRAMTANPGMAVAVRWDRTALRARARAGTLPPLFDRLIPVRRRAAVDATAAAGWRERLADMPSAERDEAVRAAVRAELDAILGFGSGAAVQEDRTFRELGLDSLGAVRFRDRMRSMTGLRLPVGVVFDHPSPREFARYVLGELTGAVEAEPVAVPRTATAAGDPVVIVGMGCRFPGGADDADALWQMIADGRDVVGDFPVDRGWDVDRLYDPEPGVAGKTYTCSGGFLSGAGDFDAGFFGISPREALGMDPQQRLLLEVAWEALEDAGIDPHGLRGSETGVFTGLMYHDYPGSDAASGSLASGRLSYTLGLHGPALTVDTACSSSLVALHLACRSIRSGECELALAGGVTVMATPEMFVEFSRQRGLSPDGHCRSFGAGADGTGWAEGVGVLVLERLSRAREQGHTVLAVIAGSAVNQDGASNGLTAPHGPAQQRVIRAALASAGLSVGDIDVVEGHGTATRLGDPIEIDALLATYGQRDRAGDPVWLGSVKSNMGHAQAAAGVAGVIKMVQAMRHGVLPKSLYCEQPSPHVDWEAGNVRLLDRAREWRTPEGRPRRAGISSFGISGTNAHLVLEQAPVDSAPDRAAARTDPGPVAWVLSARSAPALAAQAARLHRFVTAAGAAGDDADIGWSLALRSRFDQRAVVVGRSRAQLAAGLLRLAERQPAGLGSPVVGRTVPGRLVWVFTGQGSQRTGMGQRLRTVFPSFAAAWDEVVEALDVLLADVLREADANSLNDVVAAPDSLLESTSFAQPALFAFQVALARLWQSWGIRPDYLMGHSVGEIAAAHVAGVLSLPDAATVVAARARSMGRLPAGGAMVSIAATEEQVAQVLAEVGAGAAVDIAAVNGPRAVVVSGAGDAVDAVAHALAARGFRTRPLRVSHAFHSALMDPALDEFAAAVAGIRTRPAAVPMISNLIGELIADTHDHGDGFGSAAYWTRHIRRPVRFRDGVAAARRAGAVVFAEIGPAAALSAAILETCSATPSQEPQPPVVVTATAARDDAEDLAVLTAAARVWSTGVPVDWQALYQASARRVTLPTYAFQRSRYWPAKPGGDAAGLGLEPTGHALLGAMTSTSAGQWIWTGGVGVPTHPWLADHVVAERILFPGTAFVELAVAAARRAGAGTLRELTLVRPLILTAHESVHLQLVLDPPRTDRGETTRRLAVFSRPRDRSHGDGEPWTKHAEGVVGDQRAAPVADMVADRPPQAEPLDPATAYAELAERGYRYGPVFRGLRAAWRSGADVLVETALPEGTATDGFLLHPALLDALLHGWLLTRAETGDTPVPFEWTGVYLAAAECRSVRARIRDLGGNRLGLTVVTPDGVLVASVDAVMLRDAGAGFGAGEAGEGDLLHRIDWPEIAAPAARMPSVTVVSGVEDLDRAEATAELVLVDRRRGGVEPDAVRAAVHDLLRLLVRWSSDGRFARSRLAVITCGAVDVDGAGVTDLAGAAVWGLIRSARAELPDRVLLVDVDRPDGDLARLGGAGEFAGVEPAVAVREGRLRAPRLLPFDGRPLVPEAPDWVFGLAEHGTVDGLVAVPRARRPQDLAPDEVLIAVEAIGLNFRDALIALGLYPDPDATVGSEAAGIVVAVGSTVPELSAGDRVTGIFAGPVGSSAVADHRYLVRIPKDLGVAQAAAVPVAFATACYGLCDLAGVRPGEAVLIHAAAGGVGQAAVQVARRLGAEVFATASPGKWDVLRAMGIPEHRIAHSRGADFADRFLAATDGRGVDVVLNSLAGESVDASLRLLPRGGAFLEMGKTDMRDSAELERRHPGVRYRPYDLFDAGPDRIRRILASVVDDIAAGALTPPAVTRWSLPRIRDALRHLGQGRSIGKNVVTPAIPRDGTILITGGTGALGAVIARHLVRAHGVRTLILTGRRGAAAPGAADLITDLRGHGAHVTVRACDIADRDAVAELLAAVPAAAPLRGIVHAAGVSDDATIANLTPAQLDSVLRPKVDGAWQLHEQTRALDLPLFVVFSSIAGIAGTAGQANYAAANAFLDGLVSYRRDRGLAATSIAWGPWDGAGMAARLRPADLARLERLGLRPLPADLAVRLFDLALGADTVLTAARWHRSGPARLLRSRPLPDRVSMPTVEQEDAVASASTLVARVRSAAPDRRTTVALHAVREEAAHLLGHASGRAIEPEQPLGELGFDSLAAVEFRNRLAAITGLPLPSGLIYDHPTALALARYLVAALTDDETESDEEASIRRILGNIPISTLRDSGLLPALLRLADRTGAQDEPPAPDDIDAMDVAGLVELALESDIEGTK